MTSHRNATHHLFDPQQPRHDHHNNSNVPSRSTWHATPSLSTSNLQHPTFSSDEEEEEAVEVHMLASTSSSDVGDYYNTDEEEFSMDPMQVVVAPSSPPSHQTKNKCPSKSKRVSSPKSVMMFESVSPIRSLMNIEKEDDDEIEEYNCISFSYCILGTMGDVDDMTKEKEDELKEKQRERQELFQQQQQQQQQFEEQLQQEGNSVECRATLGGPNGTGVESVTTRYNVEPNPSRGVRFDESTLSNLSGASTWSNSHSSAGRRKPRRRPGSSLQLRRTRSEQVVSRGLYGEREYMQSEKQFIDRCSRGGETLPLPPLSGASEGAGGGFYDDYYLTHKIDNGAFSTVWETVHRPSNSRCATKIIDRRYLTPQADESVHNEAACLLQLHPQVVDLDEDFYTASSLDGHEGIIRCRDFFFDRNRFFIVMDLMEGGALFDRLNGRRKRKGIEEKNARVLARNLLMAVRYMHSRGVVHRDLKPENILMRKYGNDMDIRIADFGLAAIVPVGGDGDPSFGEEGRVEPGRLLTDRCGTPSYIAPEILRGMAYGSQADMWSLGVVLYFVLGGYPPFVDKRSKRGLFRKIVAGEYYFHDSQWHSISDSAKDLISRLLVVDPDRRLTAERALLHPWVKIKKEKERKPSTVSSSSRSRSAPSLPSHRRGHSTPVTSTQTKIGHGIPTLESSLPEDDNVTLSTITTEGLSVSDANGNIEVHPSENTPKHQRTQSYQRFKRAKNRIFKLRNKHDDDSELDGTSEATVFGEMQPLPTPIKRVSVKKDIRGGILSKNSTLSLGSTGTMKTVPSCEEEPIDV